MLSGRTPFDGATPMAVMMAQANKAPPNLREVNPDADATESVIALINDCMAKEREARPADMQAVLRRVQQIQYELGEVSSVRLPAAALGINASGGMASKDRATPLPQVSGASDAGPTPEFAGAVGTLAPGSLGTDDFTPPRRTGVWLALGAVLLIGGGVAVWQMNQPEAAPAAAADQTPARVTVVPDKTKSYQITSTPKAFVHLAGESQGLTPIELRLDPSKAWRVELRADGHQPATIDFDADLPDDGRVRHVKLEKIPDTPRDWLTLVSDPPGAEIYRGANYLGTTPYEWKPEVDQLPVELKFSLKGYSDHAVSVKLQAAGEAAREFKVALEAPKAAVAPPKPTPAPQPVVRRRRRPVT
ncbi:MAG: hypothetical protein KC613_27680, partial [Myxococcales bacterium]|nr:hypothetical protein [Myxococcales bacterium]